MAILQVHRLNTVLYICGYALDRILLLVGKPLKLAQRYRKI